ncbi:lysM and peptidoglycan-binding domain-containing 1 [Brachionus plicatilis]|uniref:LysM and peptidoglycan-binding domain-containing 1 n=1 Tax=Brachionus plicatilis TaxID=10195 RepID=A0A3M7PVW7_BRAPC|nr:lysM and peptidoglycan-binding domain-containing 1 [Brachionus plicatilis]
MTSAYSSCEIIEETERRSLRPSKTTKKSNYGSLKPATTQPNAQLVNYKYRLKEGETLPGLSLKFNIPIDAIKKANKLWSNDLAFIKEYLIIPIEKSRFKELDLQEESLDHDQIDLKIETDHSDDFNFYFNKFDWVISESKLKLKSLESHPNLKNSACNSDTSYTSTSSEISQTPECMIMSPHKHSNVYMSNSHLIRSSASNLSRARLAQENLERLEREKDDLFEL